jgi:F-type H+-transporting ATPase subunit a
MNISLAAEPIFHIGGFAITNSLLVSWVVVLLLVLLARMLGKRTAEVPRGLQNVAESVIEVMLSFADSVTGDRKQSERFLPMVGAIFFFVLVSNWMGLLPGFGSIGRNEMHNGHIVLVPFFRAASADLNFTIALAIISVVAAQVYGMRTVGSLAYWGKFFVPPWKSPYVIGTFVGLLEFISEFAKIISFSFRLFGNVFAGEILLAVMAFLAPVLAPIPFFFLEIFVGVVQAMVFAMLSLVFFKIATETHGAEGHAEHHEDTDHIEHAIVVREEVKV